MLRTGGAPCYKESSEARSQLWCPVTEVRPVVVDWGASSGSKPMAEGNGGVQFQ